MHDEVLGEAHVTGTRPGLGFVLADPHELGERVRRVHPVAEDLVGASGPDIVREPFGLRAGPGVRPDDRRTHRLVPVIEEDGAHHLAADDETGDP